MGKGFADVFVFTGWVRAIKSILRTRETRFLNETGFGKNFVIFDSQVKKAIGTMLFLNFGSINESPLSEEVGFGKIYELC